MATDIDSPRRRSPTSPSSFTVSAGRAWAVLVAAPGQVQRWFAGVLGADKYQRYLEYHAAHGGPGSEPMSEREFWRDWQDHQQNNPQGRCC